MKLTFLGTSAGEGYPGFWCECPNCVSARQRGGRNLRGNSCAMIDDDVLIDMNTHYFDMVNRLRLSPSKVTLLLVTHPHRDHFAPQLLTQRAMPPQWLGMSDGELRKRVSPCFTDLPTLHIYGNSFVLEALNAVPGLMERAEECRVCFHEIREGRQERCGDVTFLPIRAIHGHARGFSHSYVITRGGKTLLYASDAGGYDEDQMSVLLSQKYDCVVMEGTFGFGATVESHMNLEKNREFLRRLNEASVWKGEPNLHLTHICPHWAPPHDEYAPIVEREGMNLAYDGKSIEI